MENWIKLWLLLLTIISIVSTFPSIEERTTVGSIISDNHLSFKEHESRVKRSPFIMAFRVTKPPGMFHMSLRRPFIFNMMSNITRSMFSSNIVDMFRRGFGQDADGSNSSTGRYIDITSRQEDLELFDK